MSYQEYLRSDHWGRVRSEKLKAADWMCERCGEGAKRRGDKRIGLHVHHLTYDRVGSELLEDLVVLCIHCHEVEHGFAEDTDANRIKVRRRLAVGVVEFDDGLWDVEGPVPAHWVSGESLAKEEAA